MIPQGVRVAEMRMRRNLSTMFAMATPHVSRHCLVVGVDKVESQQHISLVVTCYTCTHVVEDLIAQKSMRGAL